MSALTGLSFSPKNEEESVSSTEMVFKLSVIVDYQKVRHNGKYRKLKVK